MYRGIWGVERGLMRVLGLLGAVVWAVEVGSIDVLRNFGQENEGAVGM